MIYSYRIEQAIRAAAVLHKDHIRKGKIPYPYITHLYTVATMVSEYTNEEDVIIGALLHDTLEDTNYAPDELEGDFGSTVRTLVESVSERIQAEELEEKSWKDRKRRYIENLKESSEGALIISAADKIHNMRSAIEEYYDDHQGFIADFQGSPTERVMVYQEISNILNRRLNNDIVAEFNHVFDEYKNFIADVKKETNYYETRT